MVLGHPVEALRGAEGSALQGRTVALGVDATRGAPGAVRVARALARLGARVVPLVNPSTLDWVPAAALEYATGVPPAAWPTHASYDAVLLAPLGPGMAQHLRLGLPDAAPCAAALAHLGKAPVLAAPAPGLDPALVALQGSRVVDGFDAHGEPFPEDLAAAVAGALAQGPLRGRRVLVAGGGAHAAWDAMRTVGTRGDAAHARGLARALRARGAEVVLALGPGGAPLRAGEHGFATAADLDALAARLGPLDLALVEDAFPSHAPAEGEGRKIPSGQHDLALALRPSAQPLAALPPGKVRRHAPGASLEGIVAAAEDGVA